MAVVERNQKLGKNPEEVKSMRILTAKVMSKLFKMNDSGINLFNEHIPELMRSSKVQRKIENVATKILTIKS